MTSLALFTNAFGPDGLIIFLVILLLFGAKKLPELARGLGQAVKEFSRAKDDIEQELTRPPSHDRPKELDSKSRHEMEQELARHDEAKAYEIQSPAGTHTATGKVAYTDDVHSDVQPAPSTPVEPAVTEPEPPVAKPERVTGNHPIS